MSEPTTTTLHHTGFDTAWWGSDLGSYRPCDATYQRYPLESLPPLDPARFVGTFDWLAAKGQPVPGEVAALEFLAHRLSEAGLSLPADFTTFYTHSGLLAALDEVSVTACWTDISDPLPCPFDPGARFVQFLRDQQDCLIWYLYLRPGKPAAVVVSPLMHNDEEEEPEFTPAELDTLRTHFHACADSFEEFAYRFWTENNLWGHARDRFADDTALPPAQRAYLAHYLR
ncbi:hypothetical protein [Streptomyces bohaiensis]|uniref:SMI1/KNR4 family protein n=1 Tax=Streptomyces bohaiensis TaxID=1431344 RepID=A0ABX1C5S1_9ACTN|nr:hypothetical protein [Streptomyces bohaiensis]NJQ14550.1 hypothetical protein [Streptomyces bohaiensis]